MDSYHFPEKVVHSHLSHSHFVYQPIMIYYFVDPFCPDCWQFDILLRKLTAEYGQLFTIRPVIKYTHGEKRNLISSYQKPLMAPGNDMHIYYGSLGIKAAALQGNKKGRQFLSHMQEAIFLYQKQISLDTVFDHAMNRSSIDQHEFFNDLHGNIAKKAYMSDKQLQEEMGVTQFPSLIFSSQFSEDPSIKVPGFHHYETYTFILRKMLGKNITPQETMTIVDYLQHYKKASTTELAFICNLSKQATIKQLKQLKLMQKVIEVIVNNQHYWKLK